jgi:hypothetical protein
VRGIAGEQHAAVAEAGHALAREAVDAGPFELELRVFHGRMREQRTHPRQDALGSLFGLGVGIPAELEVDAPHRVGLLVQQHALAGMERRVEPEPALGREVHCVLEAHVGDQEAISERAALGFLADQRAHARARAVAGHHVLGSHGVDAIGRAHLQCHAVGRRLHAAHLVLPAQVDQRQLERALHQVAFDVVLLDVDERRPFVRGLGLQVEAVDRLLAQEHASGAPRHALVDQPLSEPQPVEDLERAFGEADRARAGRQAVVVVEQQHRHLLQREVDRQRQAHRPGTDHHHRMADRQRAHRGPASGGTRRRSAGSPSLGQCSVGTGPSRDGAPSRACGRSEPGGEHQDSSAFHICWSRSAVQTRGSAYCVASS